MKQKKSFAYGYSIVAFCFLGFFLTTYFDVMSPNVFVPALAAKGFQPSNLLLAHSIGGICGVHPITEAIRKADYLMYLDKAEQKS